MRGDALILALGGAQAPAIERRLSADGYAVTILSADDGDLPAQLGERKAQAVVLVAGLPAPAGAAETAVVDLITALDDRLATAGLLARSLFTQAPPPRPSRLVFVLDWSVGSIPGRTAASAVSGGLLGLARSWSLEFAPLGVTVNAVVAGPDAGAEPVFDASEEAFLVRRPTPDDVAHAAAFFLDRQSDAITGQVLMVCGGRTAGRVTI